MNKCAEKNEADDNGVYDPVLGLKLPPEVSARIRRLRNVLPPLANQPAGGYLGKMAHLSGYTWEGVAVGMLMSLFTYLVHTLIFPADLKEKIEYSKIPEDLRFEPNAQGEWPKLYAHSIQGDKIVLDVNKEVDLTKVTEMDIWANGYMPRPNIDTGLRNRLREFMHTMGEVEMTPVLARIVNIVRGNHEAIMMNQDKKTNILEQKMINNPKST